ARPDAGFFFAHAAAERDHDSAGFVTGDHRIGAAREAGGGVAGLEAGAVDVQVAAAHAGRLDFEHDVARSRRRIGEVAQFKLAVAEKHDAFHVSPPAF